MEMEISEYSHLEELIMTPKTENNGNPFLPDDQFFVPNAWSLTCFDETQDLHFPEFISPPELSHPSPILATLPEYTTSYYKDGDRINMPISTALLPINQDEFGFLDNSVISDFDDVIRSFIKDDDHESGQLLVVDSTVPNMNVGFLDKEKKMSRVKKLNGQSSKNLMAERRRRKRLNDRLSMLRSIVPKFSKMDRTSILGDTIDYTRELLDKIHKLEGMDDNLNHINLIGNYIKDQKPNEMLLRNPPKFNVERRKHDTRVEISCMEKPGLLISTLNTLDAIGLDIHQCVVSCFNDFSLRASCHEAAEHQSLVSCEDIKQALFTNAGYGGRCI